MGTCSLIVAAPAVDPCSAMDALLPLLRPSGAFVLYSPTLHPLTRCMDRLMKTRAAVAMKLVEPWFREHQARSSQSQHSCTPEAYRLKFSVYQSGVDSNRP